VTHGGRGATAGDPQTENAVGFTLTIEQGRGSGQAFDFDDEEITIGRTDENDVVLYDGGVSRNHCRVYLDQGRWHVEDLESQNGTQLNGQKVRSEPLEAGDKITVGATVFRFDPGPGEGGSSTRIVSLEQAERARESGRPAPRKGATPAASSFGRPRIIVAGVAVVGVLLVAALVSRLTSGDSGAGDCPGAVPFDESTRTYTFGTEEGICRPGPSLDFGFNGARDTKYLLHFSAFYVDSGELEVLLNGTRIGAAPASPDRKGLLQTLSLPADKVSASADNYVTFKNTRGSGEVWGLERVELEAFRLTEADANKAKESFDLGEAKLREKNVAAPNLYQAWIYFRAARRYSEGLEPKPAFYSPALQRIRDTENELDKKCRKLLFQAEQKSRYQRLIEANQIYDSILSAFPGDAHPCRAQAEGSKWVIGEE